MLLDVTSQSLGIETAGGEMAVLIHKNSTIPMNVRQNFTTATNNQDNVKVQVRLPQSKVEKKMCVSIAEYRRMVKKREM